MPCSPGGGDDVVSRRCVGCVGAPVLAERQPADVARGGACRGCWSKADSDWALERWRQILDLTTPSSCYEPRTELFREGETAEHVWLVEEGIVLLFRALPSGNEAVLGLRFPGQLVDQCSHPPSASHQYSARTVSSCQLYRIDGDDFRQRVADDPRAAEFIQHLLRRDLRHLGCSLLDLKTQPIEARFCRCLLLLASALGVAATGPELRLLIPLRDEELAGLIGASARQFKRVKRRLQERGILRVLRPHELAIAVDRLAPNVAFDNEWRAHGG